ncbi:MAG TPA: glycerol-3-phosphate dehydrogenase [Bacteroidetes bacterium]|nr:glycerol-3-phosphate dehydrogenase [Bacteroidota bacterium]HRK03799.1 NAD(P)H-dependent glycerol-3-phosphate dehydrogenase [Chlorobiota bacterium]
MKHVAVIGAGAWGTALAVVAATNQHRVSLWARESDVVSDVNTSHRNLRFLPDAELQSSIYATDDLASITDADIVIVAIPTQHIRSTLTAAPLLRNAIVVNVAKGIEIGTHLRVSEILGDLGLLGDSYTVLSGPSHAEEVVKSMPTTVVVASQDDAAARVVQDVLSTDDFRVYTSDDVIGVEICGALKNVIAIASGVIDGLGMGDNTKAALITRGLAEIARLGVALGATPSTFYGLAGLGDLYVTCSSRHSRNRFVGEELGKGRTLDSILSSMTAVAEGVTTTRAALELAATVGVELPITEKIAGIMFAAEDPRDAIRELMTRPTKDED